MKVLEQEVLLMLYESPGTEDQLPVARAFKHMSHWHHQSLGKIYERKGRLPNHLYSGG